MPKIQRQCWQAVQTLGRHIENMKSFGVPVIVAINHFIKDTDAEIAVIQEFVANQGSEAIVSRHWELGSGRL